MNFKLKSLILYSKNNTQHFHIGDSSKKKAIDTSIKKKISTSLDDNKKYLEKLYNMPLNGDIVFRDISFYCGKNKVKGLIVSVDGLSDGESINECILKPLMRRKPDSSPYTAEQIYTSLIPQGQITLTDDINDMAHKINIGNAILFFDGLDTGMIADVKSWEHRGVDSPSNEAVIQGPHEGFNEVLRTNTALIRKSINSHNLIMENVSLGKTSKTPGALVYMANVANTTLVNEVKFRLKNIDAEYILSVLDVEKYTEEASFLPIPQMLTTERPDRVCKSVLEGKIALVMNGSSHVLVMPATVFDLASSVEDSYLRFPYSMLISFIRLAAIFTAALAPAVFVAICEYHRELILTPLLLAIQSSRVSVPFSIISELLLMEVVFELIKEAGVRMPGAIGSTLGIVGGLILGQSAVEANIVSPIMIIIVAVTGLAEFAIPSYTLSFSFRFSRFIYIFGAAAGGFFGLSMLLFINTLMYVCTLSFGVGAVSPLAPASGTSLASKLFTPPLWRQNYRPSEAKPTDKEDKAFISRKWIK